MALMACAACAAGCGSYPPSPGEIAQNYVTAVAQGDYVNACAQLDGRAREALSTALRSTAGCPGLLARCLPTKSTVLQRDQVQLLYANITTSIAGSRATVETSGTAVADRIHELTLAKAHGQWELTSYGRVRCRRRGSRR